MINRITYQFQQHLYENYVFLLPKLNFNLFIKLNFYVHLKEIMINYEYYFIHYAIFLNILVYYYNLNRYE
jgi:hypothetical protein